MRWVQPFKTVFRDLHIFFDGDRDFFSVPFVRRCENSEFQGNDGVGSDFVFDQFGGPFGKPGRYIVGNVARGNTRDVTGAFYICVNVAGISNMLFELI